MIGGAEVWPVQGDLMNLNGVRMAVLCTAAIVSPLLLFGQGAGQMQNNQPSQPGQNPNATGAGAGMAGAMAGTAGTNDPEGQGMRDKLFIHKAAEGGMAEIQLSQLAVQKSSSDEVKQFAQKMVDDHTMLNDSMKPIADQMGVKPPTKLAKKDQAELDKLNGLSGDDFDKEYLAYMVKDHHSDVRDFKQEDAMAGNSDLKAAVDKGLPVIQQHTMMVDKLAKSKGVGKS
jgi:putative membrane protein